MNNFFVSLVIPAYNEERRLPATFAAVKSFVVNRPFAGLEIIFVNDGSRDGTEALIKNFCAEFSGATGEKARYLSYAQNRGKGYAVKTGILAAAGEYILMADVDMSTPLSDSVKFLPFMAAGAPVIIGVRKGAGAVLHQKQPWYRQKMGEAYAILARWFTGLKIQDFGCGFKMFNQKAARKIFSQLFITGWIFDTEALFLAKKLGYPVVEVGVNWTDDRDTRVKIGSSAIGALRDLFLIRFRHL